MPNSLSGTDWNSYTQQTQQGGGGPQTPQMFQEMTSGLGQPSGNATPTPPTTPATPDLSGGATAPAGGSFNVDGLGLVPGLNDFRSFMSYSSPTQQSIKSRMESAGVFDQFAPYLQRDAEVSPWALNALGAYGPQNGRGFVPLEGATGTPFGGFDPSALMTLLQQRGIASGYTDPTAQTDPTQVPTSQPPPPLTPQQQMTNRQQDNSAYTTALTAATGGYNAGVTNPFDEARRRNLAGQAAFNQVGGGIQSGAIPDPFLAAGLPSLYGSYGYTPPTPPAPATPTMAPSTTSGQTSTPTTPQLSQGGRDFGDAATNLNTYNQLRDWAIANNRPDVMEDFFRSNFPNDPNVMNAALSDAFGSSTPGGSAPPPPQLSLGGRDFGDAATNLNTYNTLREWAITNNRPDVLEDFFRSNFPNDPNVMNVALSDAFGSAGPGGPSAGSPQMGGAPARQPSSANPDAGGYAGAPPQSSQSGRTAPPPDAGGSIGAPAQNTSYPQTNANPYGTGIPQPTAVQGGMYGPDNQLTLDDLNNPNLSESDRLYLAFQSLYYNPTDLNAFNNASNWAQAMGRPDLMQSFFQSQYGGDTNLLNTYMADTFGPNASLAQRPVDAPMGTMMGG